MQRILPGCSENIDFDLYPIPDPGSVVRLSLLIFAKVFVIVVLDVKPYPYPFVSLDLCVNGKLPGQAVCVCVCVAKKINENENEKSQQRWITVFDSSSEYSSSSDEEIITPNLLVEHDVGL